MKASKNNNKKIPARKSNRLPSTACEIPSPLTQPQLCWPPWPQGPEAPRSPLSICSRFTGRLRKSNAMPGDFFPIIFIFYVTVISTNALFHLSRREPPGRGKASRHAPGNTHTAPPGSGGPPRLGHQPGPRSRPPGQPLSGWTPSGWTPAGCPAAEGPQAPLRADGSCPAERQCPSGEPSRPLSGRGRLSPSIISCGPSPLSAAILLLLPPPPSGNRLDRCRSQSEPSAGDVPQPITPAGGTLGGGAAPRPLARMRSGPASFWGL